MTRHRADLIRRDVIGLKVNRSASAERQAERDGGGEEKNGEKHVFINGREETHLVFSKTGPARKHRRTVSVSNTTAKTETRSTEQNSVCVCV